MKNYFSNEGELLDGPPSPVMPAQTLSERMGLTQPEPIVAGPLSDEHKKILAQEDGIDRRTMNDYAADGRGVGEYFKAAAGGDSLDQEVAKLCASFGVALAKSAGPQPFRIERDQLSDGTWSVSEFAEDGRLLRGWVSADGEPPAAMR